ncbi:MAG: 4Fe-4S binding protein [Alphaproteobacteria bacterium]|nr:4Fe-4S binding protein [Alphaproteobacteria bacterium]
MKKKKISVPLLLRLAVAGLIFTAVCLTFAGIPDFSPAVKAQLFPSIDRKAWGIAAILLIFTFLFGRFYCSVLCPFGILQDIIAFLSRRKAKADTNRPKLRYAIAATAFAAFAAGSACLIGLLDPYSNFGRIIAFIKNPSYIAGSLTLAAIVILAVWKKRIFCTSICPVGTLLGLCAKFTPFKMRLSDKCVKCRKCVSVCPSGCVDPDSKMLDNERCVRCLKCTAVCPVKAIGFDKQAAPPAGTDLSRRSFLTGSLTTAAAVGTGVVFASRTTVHTFNDEKKRPICPPGATTAQEFAAKCTNCQLCVAGCPGKVLRPRSKQYQTVHLEYGENHCLYDCHKCSSVCPTGALIPMSLADKQRRRIGLAEFSAEKCVGCGLCADTCPRNAVTIMEVDGEDKAVLSAELCIGCGACAAACPLPEKAVHIAPVLIQSQAALKG